MTCVPSMAVFAQVYFRTLSIFSNQAALYTLFSIPVVSNSFWPRCDIKHDVMSNRLGRFNGFGKAPWLSNSK